MQAGLDGIPDVGVSVHPGHTGTASGKAGGELREQRLKARIAAAEGEAPDHEPVEVELGADESVWPGAVDRIAAAEDLARRCRGDLQAAATLANAIVGTTSPALPAQISLNGVIADSWGLNWLELPPGDYTVGFSHVEGYSEPADQVVTVTVGATTTVAGTFTARGSLRVTTSPAVAGQISVDGIPRNNWGMWTDLPTGAHQVCFGPLAGYTPPTCQSITVNAGALTNVTGTYTVSP